MRDYMKYKNHVGETFIFGSKNVVINENDFRNYEWTYNSQYNKITSFEKRIKSKKLHVIFVGTMARTDANRLLEIIEKDVLSNKPGSVIIGDYYIKGYFYASNKTSYTHSSVIELDLSFISDQCYWVKEFPFLFRVNDEGSAGSDLGLGYDYGYPYAYTSPISSENLNNTSFVASNVIIKIYGAAINPKVVIGSNTYQINTTLNNNEVLTINTRDKTAIKRNIYGVESSVFSLRDLNNYLFEKVQPGTSRVSCMPEFNFDLVLLEERSEPAWT